MKRSRSLFFKIISFLVGTAILSVFPAFVLMMGGGPGQRIIHSATTGDRIKTDLGTVAIFGIPLLLIIILAWVVFGRAPIKKAPPK